MEEKHLEKKRKDSRPGVPRRPQPRGRGEPQGSLYHIVFMILVGVLLCLAVGVYDFLSQEDASTTDTTESMEYFE
jgi:hypothetical protein